LFTLQSSSNLDAAKVAYLLLTTAAVAVAAVGFPWWLSEGRSALTRPWVISSFAIVALLIVSVVVSRAHGTSLTSWLRDSAPYALFAVAPILAFACARKASRQWLVAVFVLCGSLASLSVTVEWIGRRQLAVLPIDRIVLPTGDLASALMAIATALAVAGASRNWKWATTAGIVLGLFFATGTRTTLLLLAVPIGIAMFAGRPRGWAAKVVLTEVALAIAVFFIAEFGLGLANGNLFPSTAISTPSAGSSGSSGNPVSTTAAPPPRELAQRLEAVATLVTNPGSDQSFQERIAQTKAAWQAFTSSPLVGVGPGYNFRWTNSANLVVETFSLDTPVVYIAKFGLLGLVPVALFVAAYLRLALELWRRRQRARIEYLAVVGFAIVLSVASIQGSPVEDKGASFALILMLALGLHALIRQDPEEELVDLPLPANLITSN
jgi:hypothetical protein